MQCLSVTMRPTTLAFALLLLVTVTLTAAQDRDTQLDELMRENEVGDEASLDLVSADKNLGQTPRLLKKLLEAESRGGRVGRSLKKLKKKFKKIEHKVRKALGPKGQKLVKNLLATKLAKVAG